MAITRAELNQMIRVINKKTGLNYGLDIDGGGFKFVRRTPDNCGIEKAISSRITKGQMYYFLYAFDSGIDETLQAIRKLAKLDKADTDDTLNKQDG